MNHPDYKVLVIAVGGAGIKICTRLKENVLKDANILGVDLTPSAAPFEILPLGDALLESFGSGGDAEVVRKVAEGRISDIEARISMAKVVIIITGLGGGTSGGLAPLVGECAIKSGALAVTFATMPFGAEGNRRTSQGKEALATMRSSGICTIAISNDTLLRSTPNGHSMEMALQLVDRAIMMGLQGLEDTIASLNSPEDFERLKKILCGRNVKTLFAYADVSGSQALGLLFPEISACPLLHSNDAARSADHLILRFRHSPDIAPKEINLIISRLAEKFGVKGEKISAMVAESSWTESRISVFLLGQPDPEIRKKQNAAAEAVAQAAKAMKAKLPPSSQTEFGFNLPMDQKGLFDGTDPNIYHGEDVDIPTYIRKNLRIIL